MNPEIECECCCGKTAVIHWDGERYYTYEPGWIFSPSSENCPLDHDDAGLWNCGAPGHRQRYARLAHVTQSSKE